MNDAQKLDQLCKRLIAYPHDEDCAKKASLQLDRCQNEGNHDGSITAERWHTALDLINARNLFVRACSEYSGTGIFSKSGMKKERFGDEEQGEKDDD